MGQELSNYISRVPPRWLHIRLGLLMFLQLSIPGAWFPLFPVYLKGLGFSPTEVAWCCSTSALAAMLAPLFWGQVADRWVAAQRCISLCAMATGVLLFALARVSHPLPMFLVSLASWFFMIPVFTLATALTFRQLSSPEKQYGPVRMWGTIGWVAAGLTLTAWLSRPESFEGLQGWMGFDQTAIDLSDSLRLGGTLAFVLSCYALTLPATPPFPRRQDVAGGNRLWAGLEATIVAFGLFRKRSFCVFCVCLFGLYLTMPFSHQMTPLVLQQQGVSEEWLPSALTVAQSLEAFTLGILPVIRLRLGEKGTLFLGIAAWTVALGVLTIGRPTGLVIASLGLHGIYVCCFLVAGQVFVNRHAPPDIRASAQALLQCVNGIGLFVGHQLAGWLRSQAGGDVGPAFGTATVIAGVLVVVFVLGFRTGPD